MKMSSKGEQKLTAEVYPSEIVDSKVNDGKVEGDQRPEIKRQHVVLQKPTQHCKPLSYN